MTSSTERTQTRCSQEPCTGQETEVKKQFKNTKISLTQCIGKISVNLVGFTPIRVRNCSQNYERERKGFQRGVY